MKTLTLEVRHAFRRLRCSPGFTASVVLTLAAGIGANAAIFSVVHTVVFASLPHESPERLVTVSGNPWTHAGVILDLMETGRSFSGIAASYPRRFAITSGDLSADVEGARVTPGFLELFPADLALGRGFRDADAVRGAPGTAIVSWGAWQRRWGGRSDVIGTRIVVEGEVHEIIGVTDRGFRPYTPRTTAPEVWLPFGLERTDSAGDPEWAILLGRLASGATLGSAQRELEHAARVARATTPDPDGPPARPLRLAPLSAELVRDSRPALILLQLATLIVLLLAAVNIANMLLVRFGGRRAELGIRSALGASRSRLLREMVTESLLLSGLGGLAGIALAAFVLRLVVRLAPPDVPRLAGAAIDVPVLTFTLFVSIAAGLLFGALPAFLSTRSAPHDALRRNARTSTRPARSSRTGRALAIAQVGLTLLLVTTAGLVVRSFTILAARDPGFRTEDVLVVRLRVPEHRHATVPALERYLARIVDRLRSVPGIESVAAGNNVPIDRGNATRDYVIEGETRERLAQYGVVSPDWFRTIDVPLIRGRALDDGDRRGTPRVAVIDEAMWQAAWPGRDPIGRRFRFEDDPDAWITVVGVVADIRGNGLARDTGPGFYISWQQRPATPVELAVGRRLALLVRTRSEPAVMATAIRTALSEVDRLQPVLALSPLADIVGAGIRPHRFRAVLLAGFAGLSLVLAVAGIFGVVQHELASRLHEFGIRRAIGARPVDIASRALGWAAGTAAAGLALGIIGIAWAGPLLSGMLFGMTGTDPATVAVASCVVLATTLAACILPIVRASRVDPMVALRVEAGN